MPSFTCIQDSMRKPRRKKLVMFLEPAPYRPEADMGEAGISQEYAIVDRNGNLLGSVVDWGGTHGMGLFFTAQAQKDQATLFGDGTTKVVLNRNAISIQR